MIYKSVGVSGHRGELQSAEIGPNQNWRGRYYPNAWLQTGPCTSSCILATRPEWRVFGWARELESLAVDGSSWQTC
jgi:hypothetical protein